MSQIRPARAQQRDGGRERGGRIRRATRNTRVDCRGNGAAHGFAGTRNRVNRVLADCGTGRLSFLTLLGESSLTCIIQLSTSLPTV